jgi:hypothetical protein
MLGFFAFIGALSAIATYREAVRAFNGEHHEYPRWMYAIPGFAFMMMFVTSIPEQAVVLLVEPALWLSGGALVGFTAACATRLDQKRTGFRARFRTEDIQNFGLGLGMAGVLVAGNDFIVNEKLPAVAGFLFAGALACALVIAMRAYHTRQAKVCAPICLPPLDPAIERELRRRVIVIKSDQSDKSDDC